jgi:hypothetical protein
MTKPSISVRRYPKDFVIHVRSSDGMRGDSVFEKPVLLPALDQQDVAMHAWADAHFAIDIMAEHALFFMMLMPYEVAAREHSQAEEFYFKLRAASARINAVGPPEPSAIKTFVTTVVDDIQPFTEFKARMGEAQSSGKLHSLAWPLLFDHTRHEAERWTRRLRQLAKGESEYDRAEVSLFGTGIMDEHARFIAHLLDPDEYALIDAFMKTSTVFRHLHRGGVGGVVAALVGQPATLVTSLVKNQETYTILSSAEAILDFKTKTVRDIEAGRIKSMLEPRLADHMRREAVKFVDEIKRAV